MLADSGGSDLRETVYAIMRKLLTNKLGSLFNLMGRNRGGETSKLGFMSFGNLHEVVHGKF